MKIPLKQIGLASLLAVGFGAQGAPFQNGSFEIPTVASDLGVNVGDTAIPGWSVGGKGGINLDNILGLQSGITKGLYPQPPDGKQFIVFNAGNAPPASTWIEQSFDTQIGRSYEVSFFLGRGGQNPGDMGAQITVSSAAGEVLASMTTSAPAVNSWGPRQSLVFTATSATSSVRFADASKVTTAVDLLLDNVAVWPQPERLTFAPAASAFSHTKGFRMKLATGVWQSTEIQTSTNLIDWVPLITISSVPEGVEFIDPSATNFNRRFYRTASY